MSNYKDILTAMKYLIDKKKHCYQMKSEGNLNVPLKLCGYNDAD